MVTNQRFDELDDRTAEELLAGRLSVERADLDGVALFVTNLRALPTAPPAVVRPELAAIIAGGLAGWRQARVKPPAGPPTVRSHGHRGDEECSKR